jgi:glycerol-3-phosphate dehydrogenase
MQHFGQERREVIWDGVEGRQWDVVVVGGGIVGAGIAKEASRAGLSVVLLEAKDFAWGTSGRSSKMIHGGLRYLKERRIRVTREAVHERERLLETGRGLVDPLPFLYLTCQGDPSPSWLVGLGLAAYDLLNGHASGSESLAVHDLLLFAPNLNLEGVRGAYRYLDGVTDDARLVFRVLREATRMGAWALNYAAVEGLVKEGAGTVRGVVAQDAVGGGRAEIRAAVVVNATGVWARELTGPEGLPFVLRPLRGSHLVLPWEGLPVTHAVTFAHPRDGRPVFAYPWEGVTLVGTTDLDHNAPLSFEPAASEEEVGYLLEAVRARFQDPPDYEDLLGTFAGVRPVISGGEERPSQEPREHAVWEERNLVTVAGGKLTTFYPMARGVLRIVLKRTRRRKVGGGEGRGLEPVSARIAERAQEELRTLPHLLRCRIVGRLGPDLADFLEWVGKEDLEQIAGTPYTWAELGWAAKREAVVHLDDLLLRRARIGHLLPDGASALEEEMERRIRPLLGWTEERWRTEWTRYRRLWATHHGPRPLVR